MSRMLTSLRQKWSGLGDASEQGWRTWFQLSTLRNYGIVLSFLALFVTLSVWSDVFLTRTNLLNLLDQSATVGIIACGGTLVIIAGGFDLSAGAIFAVAGIVAVNAANSAGTTAGIIAGVAVGAALGLGNGLVTTVGRINSLIGTLASSIVIRGVALVITGGFLVQATPTSFPQLGQGKWAGVNYSVWALLAVFVLTTVVLTRAKFGRYIYASGGNAEAARLSGVRVGVVRAATFVISGACAGLAGVISASRVQTGQANAGEGIELTAIAAIVIGGTSIQGGAGAIWRSMLGVLLLAMIGNGFNLLNLDPTYQLIVQGSIIMIAVAIDAWSRRST